MFKVNEFWRCPDGTLYRIERVTASGKWVTACIYISGRWDYAGHRFTTKSRKWGDLVFVKREDFLTAVYQSRLDKPGSVEYSDEETKPQGEVNGE